MQFISALVQRIFRGTLEVVNTDGMDCEEVAALYGAALMTIGTRFHSVIFSLAQGKPSLAIGYGGNKAKGILKDINQEEWHIPIEQAEGKQLVKMAQNLLASMPRLQRKLNNLQEEVIGARVRIKEKIIRILEK
jgi:colanic acid/amylovoran biosynthesis protein